MSGRRRSVNIEETVSSVVGLPPNPQGWQGQAARLIERRVRYGYGGGGLVKSAYCNNSVSCSNSCSSFNLHWVWR